MGVTVRQKIRGKGNPWWVFMAHEGKRKSIKVGEGVAAERKLSQLSQGGASEFSYHSLTLFALNPLFAQCCGSKFSREVSHGSYSPAKGEGQGEALMGFYRPQWQKEINPGGG